MQSRPYTSCNGQREKVGKSCKEEIHKRIVAKWFWLNLSGNNLVAKLCFLKTCV